MATQEHLPSLSPTGEEAEEPGGRAEAYRERLREALRDPEFRRIEGFPIGKDEDILALSDPPYYTACPNPFLPEIIAAWQAERAALRRELGLPDDGGDNGNGGEPAYRREPFAADVSEGKSDPIYNAHSYHTKVPHKAIMRYILHYTDPGDIVFDGFCGTGMTGVAAQLCGDRREVEALGYRVAEDGTIYDGDRPISRLGARKAVLVDLSPAATFIAYNYNTPVDAAAFEREARRILREVEEECGWMYETWHPHCDAPDRVKARIDYVVWSEVFRCPECGGEITFLEQALDPETQRVRAGFECPHCGARLGKAQLERCRLTVFDGTLQRPTETLKRRPVLVEYRIGGKRHAKVPDSYDWSVLERVERLAVPESLPSTPFPIARMCHGSRLAPKGVTHVHHLFLPRARHALTALWARAAQVGDARMRAFLRFTVEQTVWGMSLLNRYGPTHYSQVNRYLTGVYYISSLISEVSPWYILDGKVRRLARVFAALGTDRRNVAIATQSASVPPAAPECLDYIFTDPPFGENIYYADLDYLVESWHRVWTNSDPEAIIDRAKGKDIEDYRELMRRAFAAYYRWLKPGRWITVEFHNSRNAVWNAIQEAMMSAGFVVADVRTLDKVQRSYRQVTATLTTKQDLVISAYKPRTGFERRFRAAAGMPEGAWAFVRQHLAQLPLTVEQDGTLEPVVERQAHLLYDRMVAFHIQRGATVPLSAAEFYAGLRERFVERDGMYFLPEQVPAYDRARLQAERVGQLSFVVSDEKSAVRWLRQALDPALGGHPQTYAELQPRFLRSYTPARHEAMPELREVLAQSFVEDEEGRWHVPDPNKASDLEKLRRRDLLREFRTYLEGRGRLRQFRTEAVRAGFADAWQRRDYAAILQVARRLPEEVLQEDPELLMYYDNASLREE